MVPVRRWGWQWVMAAWLICQIGHSVKAQVSGLVAAYSFDEGSGTAFADASGNGNNGTLSGATWAVGRFGSALSFDGSNDLATVADAASLDLSSGMTLAAWVYPVSLSSWRTIILKERSGHLAYALYANTDSDRPSGEISTSGNSGDARGSAQLPLGTWTHVATTYDGTTLRLFVNGTQVASRTLSGGILVSGGPLRIGGNLVWGEYFSGRIDEVRLYNRALTQSEIQANSTQPIGASDTTPPTVTSTTPAAGATNVFTGTDVLAAFSEAMKAETINTSTVTLRDAAGALVPASVAYDGLNRRAILDPTSRLNPTTAYTARITGGAGGVHDAAGNALTSDLVWSFTTTADIDTPTVVLRSPSPGAINVSTTVDVVAAFSEAMQPASIVFVLRDNAGAAVAATVTYDATTLTAKLRPSSALASAAAYTATVERAQDLAGNPLAAPVAWTFSTGGAGFQESIVFSGLTDPTAVDFASDGRVFVAEKSGLIKVFESLTDTTPTIFADLRTNVHNFWDRGLLGLALDPQFPTRPYVYVLYTHDAAIGGTAPRWGSIGGTSDPCPTPPGPTADGCVVSGRLSRLQASGDVQVGGEQVLIEDWGQQFPSHSIGQIAFGPDGALYVSGGDGAGFTFVDYGQQKNPLGDPPSEGGALRSQDLRTAGDPVTLNGAIARVDPETGAALPDNPLYGNPDPNARRIVAWGLRNPFRFAFRPGTRQIYVGDVGWDDWEEINRIDDPLNPSVKNFGWPCYEGANRQNGYDGANLNICENLYTQADAVTAPFYVYHRHSKVVAGESCGTGNSALSALAFYAGGDYPATYKGALFFADYSRSCIWVMFAGADGAPSPSSIATFRPGAAAPVQLKIGPGGDLFYVDIGGTIRRIRYFGGNNPPDASATATPISGEAPLTVSFDGSSSSDPDAGDAVTFAWDLDGDGFFDDGTAPRVTFTYSTAGNYTARLQVTDTQGLSDIHSLVITVSSFAPDATIQTPSSTLTWRVGDVIQFAGKATDQDDGELPPAALSWTLTLQHCSDAGSCHAHPLQTISGVSQGSFTAPDHDYPSYLDVTLAATDSSGLTDTETVRLNPKTVTLAFESAPSGLVLTMGSQSLAAPFTRTAIVGSTNSISASSPQSLAGKTYEFVSWSDGGAQTHNFVAPPDAATYRATFSVIPSLAIGDTTATETDGAGAALAFTVTLSEPAARTVTVDYAVTGGSATPGADYTAGSGTLTFAPGVTSQIVSIPIAGDTLDEANETVLVSLSGAQQAAVIDGTGVGTIADDDPPVALSVGDIDIVEGSGGTSTATFTVRLSAASGLTVSASYATASGSAVSPGDFAAKTGTITIPPGATTASIAVQVQPDTVDEPDETFFLNLSAPANATLADAQGAALVRDDDLPPPSALVAAYGFEETSGTQATDTSGRAHHGTISGATRVTTGRFGRALSFDGVDDLVTIADTSALDLTTGLTLEAWVNPRTLNSWRTLVLKERPGNLAYAMYASTDTNTPSGEIATSVNTDTRGTTRLPTGTWTHVAVTYDGAVLRLYINGAQVSSRSVSGSITVSSGSLRIGGNAVWGEYFDGVIDEVRVYNRALTAAEIQADMTAPVQP